MSYVTGSYGNIADDFAMPNICCVSLASVWLVVITALATLIPRMLWTQMFSKLYKSVVGNLSVIPSIVKYGQRMSAGYHTNMHVHNIDQSMNQTFSILSYCMTRSLHQRRGQSIYSNILPLMMDELVVRRGRLSREVPLCRSVPKNVMIGTIISSVSIKWLQKYTAQHNLVDMNLNCRNSNHGYNTLQHHTMWTWNQMEETHQTILRNREGSYTTINTIMSSLFLAHSAQYWTWYSACWLITTRRCYCCCCSNSRCGRGNTRRNGSSRSNTSLWIGCDPSHEHGKETWWLSESISPFNLRTQGNMLLYYSVFLEYT